jgi:hypothetical protein
MGTNRLVERNREAIVSAIRSAIDRAPAVSTTRPELWDGKAATRIVSLFRDLK